VLSLPDGTHFRHFGTEQVLGLPVDDIRLNRADEFVFEHMCRYPGYFTNTHDFLRLVERLAGPGGGLDPDRLRSLGLDLERLGAMKASELKVFSSLLTEFGPIGAGLTAEDFREKVRREVGDGPRSFTTPLRERLAQGIRILKQSPAARRLGSLPFSGNGHAGTPELRQTCSSIHSGLQAGVVFPSQ
jgi:hypothetical protein